MIAGLGHAAKLVKDRSESDSAHLSEMLDVLLSKLKVRPFRLHSPPHPIYHAHAHSINTYILLVRIGR